MYTLQTRMSDAIAAQPGLIALLGAFHPAFRRLEHPILGKILPRLVTVADAARVAGVDAQALLAVMNLPGAPTAPHAAAPLAKVPHVNEPEPPWMSGAPVRELDARPALEQGEEPFALIMAALRELGAAQVLTVLAPFEPAPLRRMMEDRGWRSHVAWTGETCRASFWHPPEADGAAPSKEDPDDRLQKTAEGWTLDLRQLEPPHPLRMALSALDRGALPLTLVHHREPALLYPKLTERGLVWDVTAVGDHIEVRIHAA
jgi:uncharacterized protein (DUF2249 family)